jgi:hypothetical protein
MLLNRLFELVLAAVVLNKPHHWSLDFWRTGFGCVLGKVWLGRIGFVSTSGPDCLSFEPSTKLSSRAGLFVGQCHPRTQSADSYSAGICCHATAWLRFENCSVPLGRTGDRDRFVSTREPAVTDSGRLPLKKHGHLCALGLSDMDSRSARGQFCRYSEPLRLVSCQAPPGHGLWCLRIYPPISFGYDAAATIWSRPQVPSHFLAQIFSGCRSPFYRLDPRRTHVHHPLLQPHSL